MARRAIPMIAFHGVESIYIYIIYFPVSTYASMRCIRKLRKLRHSQGLCQLMGVVRKERALELYRPAERNWN